MAPGGDEVSAYDDSGPGPLSYEEPTEDVDDPYAEVEEPDPYAEEEDADAYAEEDDSYAEDTAYDEAYEVTDGAVVPEADVVDEYGEAPEDGDEYAPAPSGEDPEYYDANEDSAEGPVDAEGPAVADEEVAGPAAAAGPTEVGELNFEGFTAYPGRDYIPSFEAAVLSQVCPRVSLPHVPVYADVVRVLCAET